MDRVDPRLVDAALQGRETGTPALDRAARVVADLRRVLLEEPPPEAVSGHLDAMVSAASVEVRGPTPISSARRARRRLASLPLAAVLLLGAGLAWGAIEVPEQASDRASEAIAEAQGDDADLGETTEGALEAPHGDEVSAVARDDSLRGCEKGQAVSGVASSKGNKQGPGHDPCAKGEGGKARAEERSAKGKQTAGDAREKAEDQAGSWIAGPGERPDAAGPPESTGQPPSPGSQGLGGGGGKP